jgi:hypothetical protein
MMQLLGFCQLAVVAGIGANYFTNAYVADAFGGGLQGAILADSLGYGNAFHGYVGSLALDDPALRDEFLLTSFLPRRNPLRNTFDTFLDANALAAGSSDFFVAGAFSNTPQDELARAAIANSFGGTLSGSLIANQLIPERFGYPVKYGGGWNSGYSTPSYSSYAGPYAYGNTYGSFGGCWMNGAWYSSCAF